MSISLYVPKVEDYWYEQNLQSDPKTMSYNAGWDVSYNGYHYDTGCIDFPKEKWQESFDKRKKENRYFAYIKDNDIDEFIGYVNYHFNKSDNRYDCGILIEDKYRGKGYSKKALRLLLDEAKKNGVSELYDCFESDRGNTLDVFKSVGFEVIDKIVLNKFSKNIDGVIVRVKL